MRGWRACVLRWPPRPGHPHPRHPPAVARRSWQPLLPAAQRHPQRPLASVGAGARPPPRWRFCVLQRRHAAASGAAAAGLLRRQQGRQGRLASMRELLRAAARVARPPQPRWLPIRGLCRKNSCGRQKGQSGSPWALSGERAALVWANSRLEEVTRRAKHKPSTAHRRGRVELIALSSEASCGTQFQRSAAGPRQPRTVTGERRASAWASGLSGGACNTAVQCVPPAAHARQKNDCTKRSRPQNSSIFDPITPARQSPLVEPPCW